MSHHFMFGIRSLGGCESFKLSKYYENSVAEIRNFNSSICNFITIGFRAHSLNNELLSM